MATDELYSRLRAKLGHVVADPELRQAAELVPEIEALKAQRNAVILGHNYMDPLVYHTVADRVGDSLGLSREAAAVDADLIVFCGVHFMAETAKILNPEKTVLLPSLRGGCSLAESITANNVRDLKSRFPGVPVITYVNTSAAVKAECDVCCTSGNARDVVESFGEQTVIFLPDQYLARNVARETGRSLVFADQLPADLGANGIDIIAWRGACEVHERFSVRDIEAARRQHPDIVVLAHPECPPEVCELADVSASTAGMIREVDRRPAGTRFLLLTECAMVENLRAQYPDKRFVNFCALRCPHMSEVTLGNTRDSLRDMQHEVEVPRHLQQRARQAVERMLAIGG